MIYTLETIPYKIFLKIAKTGNLSLLTDENLNPEELKQIWESMEEEHQKTSETSETKRIFKISKEIEILEAKYQLALMICETLKFDKQKPLIEELKKIGFSVSEESTEKYINDIEKIIRESESFLIKAEELKSMLPKVENDTEFSIDDTMALYSAILGFSIGDFNQVTYTAFRGYEKQVNQKIKSINEQKK